MRATIALLACALATGLLPGMTTPAAARPGGERYRYSFVSIPDFLNADVGDVSRSPYWQEGMPRGTNETYEVAIGRVLDNIQAVAPHDVLIAGDLVEGHWGQDTEGVGVFGPVDTRENRLQALRTAADVYYGSWAERFAARGLRVHAAVGDHEIGDNPWRGPEQAFKRAALPQFRSTWARYFTGSGGRYRNSFDATTYATPLHSEVLLVTLDVFRRLRGDVVPHVGRRKLAWLRRTLASARRRGVDWVVVQGHTPVVTPVRTRFSSGLTYRGGASSPLWRTMARYGVDLYLCGEVHNVTVTQDRGITQIAHGGLFYRGQTTWLDARVVGGRMRLSMRGYRDTYADFGERLWQTDRLNLPATVEYQADSHRRGLMVLGRDGRVLKRRGIMRRYRG